jgi:hypothetical protein
MKIAAIGTAKRTSSAFPVVHTKNPGILAANGIAIMYAAALPMDAISIRCPKQ